jgi:hypothetical protein
VQRNLSCGPSPKCPAAHPDPQRRAAPLGANSNGITEGRPAGSRLICCKGSEGEQLEFVQALGPVKKTFDDAFELRRQARGG